MSRRRGKVVHGGRSCGREWACEQRPLAERAADDLHAHREAASQAGRHRLRPCCSEAPATGPDDGHTASYVVLASLFRLKPLAKGSLKVTPSMVWPSLKSSLSTTVAPWRSAVAQS